MSCFFLISLFIVLLLINRSNNNKINVNGIENLNMYLSTNKNNYLLFYPADRRFSKEHTIVKEIDTKGNLIKEYFVRDSNFRRMSIHQKPSELNNVYISFFGEAVFDNYFYIYSLDKNKFEKINLDYLKFKLGVDNLLHYGTNTLFTTFVSHITGEQNFDSNTGLFNISILNSTLKKGFETEYGKLPYSAPLLWFNNKILYSTNPTLDVENNKYDYHGIGVIDLSTNVVNYILEEYQEQLFTVFANEDFAYVLSEKGVLFIIDKNFQITSFKPFINMEPESVYYDINSPSLFLDNNTMLHSVFDSKGVQTVGFIDLNQNNIKFIPLDRPYLKPENTYKFLYKNLESKEIYLLSYGLNKSVLLVLDSDNFNLKFEVPIDDGFGLDFVLKN